MNKLSHSSVLWRHSLAPLLVLLLPTLAYAHVGVGPTSGWLAGAAHPITGLDHLAAMVGVGLWAPPAWFATRAARSRCLAFICAFNE